MKKLFLIISLASAVAFANAQDMTSKKGVPILPEVKDWSIGFGASNLIDYFGHLLSNGGNSSSNLVAQQDMTIVGLMVKDETTSFRAKFRLGFGSKSWDGFSNQSGSTSSPPATVTDTKKNSNMHIGLGAGIQKNRGKGRLRGIYGAEFGFMIGSNKDTYTYGNSINSTYTNPASHNFGALLTDGSTNNVDSTGTFRATADEMGSTFDINLNGFIGAEYFFAPKMSLSAEYGWGLTLGSTGEGKTTWEYYNGTAATTYDSKSGKSSAFAIDVMNPSASLVFHCYF